MHITAPEIAARKGKEKIVVLTAYSFPMAQILDEHVDILLVGDSLGMVLYGMDSTLPVTLNMMINHGEAVVKGSQKALVAVDMPFGTYDSPSQALENANKIITETGAQAVKLEGGTEMAETIKTLVDTKIPVIGHIGLLPQSVEKYGGYKIQGKDKESAQQILKDAAAVQESGAFSIVVEGVKKELAEEITAKTQIPIIGIGASPQCDGQVLVTEDMIGISAGKPPKFVKQYANLNDQIKEAANQYAKEVKNGNFPSDENCY